MRRASPAAENDAQGPKSWILDRERYYRGGEENDARGTKTMRGARKRCGGQPPREGKNAQPLGARKKRCADAPLGLRIECAATKKSLIAVRAGPGSRALAQ